MQISKNCRGSWRAAGRLSRRGKRQTVVINPDQVFYFLNFDISAFIPFLHKDVCGKITLSTGDEAFINFSYLPP